jgi:S-adenosylmethionine:tRNA ribosyltransferase-isomerase
MVNKENPLSKVDLKDFDYPLPKERIALYPVEKRDQSKLLFADVSDNNITHLKFENIIDLLPRDSLVVFNNTKVIAARIPAKKETGGKAEILCTDPMKPSHDPQITVASKGSCSWRTVLGGRAIKPGSVLFPVTGDEDIKIKAIVSEKDGMEGTVDFSWTPEHLSFAEVLDEIGKVPLPPYIDRENEKEDKDRYQTVYAGNEGSVAAPTAGLHFTDKIIENMHKCGIGICNLTLHVGPGTFRPVSDDDVSKHKMHEEQIILNLNEVELLYKAYKTGKKVVSVGTTSLRTLETIYLLGAKLFKKIPDVFKNDGGNFYFELYQEEAYENDFSVVSPLDSLQALKYFFEDNNIKEIYGYTSLFIVPGYEIKTIDGLITNFHMPKSTLLMLVSAFCGSDFRKEIYTEALANDYRFLSYGDSSFLLRK